MNRQQILITLFCIVGTIFCLFAFFPGGSVGDSGGILRQAIKGTYSGFQPTFFIKITALLRPFGPGLIPAFFLQVFLYWISVGVLAICALRISKWLSVGVLAISIFPYPLWLIGVVVKDAPCVPFLLFLSTIYLYSLLTKRKFLILIIVSILSLVVLLLMRHNSFSLIPAVALCLTASFYKIGKRFSAPKQHGIFVFLLCMVMLIPIVIAKGTERIIEYNAGVVRKKPYSVFFTHFPTKNMIGMSVWADHKGITDRLNPKQKKRLSKVYNGNACFWKKIRKDAPEVWNSNKTFQEWMIHIRENPKWYLGHRFHMLKKLFDGTGQRPKFYSVMWNPLREDLDKWNKNLMNSWYKQNVLFRLWNSYQQATFFKFPAVVYLPISNLLIIILFSFLAILKKLSTSGMTALYMNLLAFSYWVPFFIVTNHAEIRYVYPSNTLILFSYPFVLYSLFEFIKLKREKQLVPNVI